MPIFSWFCICCVILFLIFGKKGQEIYRKILGLYIFLYMNIEVGYFIKINDSYIRFSYFFEIFVFAFSIILFIQNIKKADKKLSFKLIIAICSVGIGIVDLIIRPLRQLIVTSDMVIDSYWLGTTGLQYPVFSMNVIESGIQYFIFLFILYVIFISFKREDYVILIKQVCNYCKISIIFGYMEFIMKNIFKSNVMNDVIDFVFGKNKNVFVKLEVRGSLYRLSGLTTEASHFAYVIFLIIIIYYAGVKLKVLNRIWLYAAVILLPLTMAFSSVLFLLALIAGDIVIHFRKNIKFNRNFFTFVSIICLVCLLVIFIMNTDLFKKTYFGKRLDEILNDKSLFMNIEWVRTLVYSSSRVRLISIITTLKLIKYRPLFGIGIGVNSSHGAFALILSCIGIIGTLCWISFLFYGEDQRQIKIYSNPYFIL